MQIVLLPSAFAPAVGGVEELTRCLANRLITFGHSVEIWTNRYPPSLPAVEAIEGLTVRRFRMPLPTGNLLAALRLGPEALNGLRCMRRATRGFSPDVFHVQCFSGNGVYASALSLLSGIPLVVTLQGETVMDDNDIYSHSVSLRTGLRLGLRTAAAVTGCSQFTLDDAVRRFGLSASAGTVVPNGVEFEAKEQETALDIPFRRFVLALGRAVDKKGFDLLIDAYHVLAGCNPETGLVIGGDGPALPGLLRRVHQYGLADRVVLPGSLSRGQVTWAMRNAEVFVLPSRIEPFGIVVLEAMSEGVPVIVSPHGGATEIVRDGIDGFVVDPFDSKALATTLGRILQEPRERVRLAEAGRARVQAYDWKAITERYLAIYRWAISEPHRASNQ